jgi:hypothetical protein
MWALVALCNKAAVGLFNPGEDGKQQLQPGVDLALPIFQLPTAQQYKSISRSKSQFGAGNSSRQNTSHQQRMQALQMSGICGCGPIIGIHHSSSWLGIATAAYPQLDPPSTAAMWLYMCNPTAALTADGQLQSGQQLQGICMEALAASLSQLQHVTSVGMASTQAAENAAALREAAAAAAAAADIPSQIQEPACSVLVVSGYGSYLQQISLQPLPQQQQQQQQQQQVQQQGQEVTCPWYADGCSGPSDGLAYQDVLTPW